MARFFVLTPEELDELFVQDPATAKDGGFQAFVIGLQRKTRRPTEEIALDEDDIERIREYASDPGRGGWQHRMLKIFGRVLELQPIDPTDDATP